MDGHLWLLDASRTIMAGHEVLGPVCDDDPVRDAHVLPMMRRFLELERSVAIEG